MHSHCQYIAYKGEGSHSSHVATIGRTPENIGPEMNQLDSRWPGAVPQPFTLDLIRLA